MFSSSEISVCACEKGASPAIARRVYSSGPSFDNIVLEQREAGKRTRWAGRAQCAFRTLRGLFLSLAQAPLRWLPFDGCLLPNVLHGLSLFGFFQRVRGAPYTVTSLWKFSVFKFTDAFPCAPTWLPMLASRRAPPQALRRAPQQALRQATQKAPPQTPQHKLPDKLLHESLGQRLCAMILISGLHR